MPPTTTDAAPSPEVNQHAWSPSALPSAGAFYKLADGSPAIPDGTVRVRKLTVQEEMILNSQGVDLATRLSMIVRNCVQLPNKYNPDDLLITDRFWLLLAQRVLTFGPRYLFQWRCRQCGAMNKADVNLVIDLDKITPETLAMKWEEKEYAERYSPEEPFSVDLPDAGVSVTVQFLRGRHETEIFKRAKRAKMQSADAFDSSTAIRTALQIVSVSDQPWDKMSSMAKEMWVRKLTMRDKQIIQIETEKRETGIDTEMYIPCKSCSADNTVPFQYDAEFFQPTVM